MKNISSDDLYSYIGWFRVAGVYGENPHYVSYSKFSNDYLFNNIATVWAKKPTNYGPVSTTIGTLLSKLAGNNLILNVLIFKTLSFFIWALNPPTKSKQSDNIPIFLFMILLLGKNQKFELKKLLNFQMPANLNLTMNLDN